MPLYCCETCGWATAGLRVDAVAAHQVQCSECQGLLRLTYNMTSPPPSMLDRPVGLFRAPAHTARRRLRSPEGAVQDVPFPR